MEEKRKTMVKRRNKKIRKMNLRSMEQLTYLKTTIQTRIKTRIVLGAKLTQLMMIALVSVNGYFSPF